MKVFISLIVGAIVGSFLTVQYIGPVNHSLAQVNHASNQMTAKASEVKQVIQKK